MYLVLFLFTLFTIWFIYALFYYIRYWKMINVFPKKHGLFFFGNILDFGSPEKTFKVLREYNKQFPKCYQLYSGNFVAININTPEAAQIILSSPKHINKSKIYKFIESWLNTGLLTSTGNKWQERRKILTPTFHFSILKRYVETFAEYSNSFVQVLEKECSKDKTDIVPLINELTLKIICETAMGISLTSSKDEEEYHKAITGFGVTLVERIIKPWLYSDVTFNLTKTAKNRNRYINMLQRFSTNIITERDKNFNKMDFNIDQDEKKRLALLDLLLLVKRSTGQIDDIGIREEVDTFMFEGHDTTSMAICFALLLFANHQDIQDKVVEELDTIFEGSARPATYQDLQQMQYLEMCLKESLRLYPSVPFIARYVEEDLHLGGKYVVPADTNVFIHIFDIHRNPDIFPDPEKFNPERFKPEAIKNRHPYAFVPFSAGPRNCIGQKYALMLLKSVVSSILRNYKLECVDKQSELKLAMEIILRPVNGIHMKFIPRNK